MVEIRDEASPGDRVILFNLLKVEIKTIIKVKIRGIFNRVPVNLAIHKNHGKAKYND
jgi:hypothetical protein